MGVNAIPSNVSYTDTVGFDLTSLLDIMITAPASPSLVQRNGASERAGEPEHNGQGVIPTGK